MQHKRKRKQTGEQTEAIEESRRNCQHIHMIKTHTQTHLHDLRVVMSALCAIGVLIPPVHMLGGPVVDCRVCRLSKVAEHNSADADKVCDQTESHLLPLS